jgi:hypothetical protein
VSEEKIFVEFGAVTMEDGRHSNNGFLISD